MIREKSLEQNGIFFLAVTKEAFESILARIGKQPIPNLSDSRIQGDRVDSSDLAEQAVPSKGRHYNTWIFQSNQKSYRLREAIRELKEQVWRVSRFRNEIRPGDRIYFWESGSDGGIVGVGEVGETPHAQPHLPGELPFIREMARFEGNQLRVRIVHVRRIETKIPKSYLRSRPDLASLSILRQPRGTNFKVSREQAQALEAIIGTYMIAPIYSPARRPEKRIVLTPA